MKIAFGRVREDFLLFIRRNPHQDREKKKCYYCRLSVHILGFGRLCGERVKGNFMKTDEKTFWSRISNFDVPFITRCPPKMEQSKRIINDNNSFHCSMKKDERNKMKRLLRKLHFYIFSFRFPLRFYLAYSFFPSARYDKKKLFDSGCLVSLIFADCISINKFVELRRSGAKLSGEIFRSAWFP